MTIDDLRRIFKEQLDRPTPEKLYYMLIENGTNLVERTEKAELESLLPMLDNFIYTGSTGDMPRFTKNELKT